jgi:signal transduction histidine kinase
VYLHEFFVIDKSGNKNIYKLSGLTIGIGVDSATVFISLVLIVIFLTKRFKRRRARKLKQKFSKLNRGQLLKQLVSQRADIGERMIITLDELDKATNNFDKARELGY